MKTVGLLTFASDNYGACLQAFAGRKKLEELGYIVKFINYKCEANGYITPKKFSLFRKALRVLNLNFFKRLKIRKIGLLKNSKFKKFKNKYILTDNLVYLSPSELKKSATTFDAIVCGSDMIWSAEFKDILDVYLLTWATSVPKISYAPSFGSIIEAEKLANIYKQALKSFKAISCREESGSKFVHNLLSSEIATVCDPTLLFEASKWKEWFNLQQYAKRPYILTYCFGGINSNICTQLENIQNNNGWDIRQIFGATYIETLQELNYGDGAYGPEEFLQLFYESEFIVVNGYHGLLFALIFNKPFVLLHRNEIEHWGAHENRMSELLQKLGLEERYISPDSVIDASLLSLDYTLVNNKISQMRDASSTYIINALADI